MKYIKGLLLGAVAASVFATGAMVTPANADGSAVIGHKKGKFYLKSKDGNYSVLPGFKFQFDAAKIERDNTFTDTDSTSRMRVRRLLLGLKGRAGSPNLTYGITLNFQATIFDAKMSYKYNPAIIFTAGNYKSIGIPIANRFSSSSGFLVDGPNGLGDTLGDRSLGFGIGGKLGKTVKYEMKVHNSAGGSNVSSESQGVGYEVGLNWEPLGRYGGFNQPDYSAKSKMRVNLNGGFQYHKNGSGTKNFEDYCNDAVAADCDATGYHVAAGVKMSGWQLAATFEHANYQTNANNESPGQRTYSTGVMASYMLVPNRIPLSVLYTLHDPDSENGTEGGNGSVDSEAGMQRQVGVGAAYLFNGHKNKIHVSWDRVATETAITAISGDEGSVKNHSFKARWQVLF